MDLTMQSQIHRIEADVTRLHADMQRLEGKIDSLNRPLISVEGVVMAAYITMILIFVFCEPPSARSERPERAGSLHDPAHVPSTFLSC
jgi:hypothetical protein